MAQGCRTTLRWPVTFSHQVPRNTNGFELGTWDREFSVIQPLSHGFTLTKKLHSQLNKEKPVKRKEKNKNLAYERQKTYWGVTSCFRLFPLFFWARMTDDIFSEVEIFLKTHQTAFTVNAKTWDKNYPVYIFLKKFLFRFCK